MLTVRNDGVGMDAETRARVFEPFYTTKELGKSIGLGLSVAYGIVKQSGGFIDVTSEPGKGSEFRVYLPAAPETPKSILSTEEGPIRGGDETILLAEDEPALREKLDKALESAGYQVLAAPDGHQAFKLALQESQRVDLLLTDVVMPGLSGYRLSERLRTYFPDIKTLYISGYWFNGEGKSAPPLRGNFIPKPFTRGKLLRRVREILDDDLQYDQDT
jgi:CheY-like chemotaxis protein